jgi:predicted permease
MLHGWFQDLRYAIRLLAKSRTFTAVAVLSLAIGIGANAAMFGVIRVLLLDPMPVRAPDELSLLYWRQPGTLKISQMSSSGHKDPATGLDYRSNVSYPIYESIREAAPDGVEVAAFNFVRGVAVSFDDQPAVLAGGLVADGRYARVLGAGLAIGRGLDESDEADSGSIAAVVSHAFWMRVFGGDPAVVGRRVRVNGLAARIVGVTAEGFRGLSKGGFFPQTEITLPLRAIGRIMPAWQPEDGSLLTADRLHWVRLLLRVRPGVSAAAIESRLAAPLRAHLAPLVEPGALPPSVRLVPAARGLDQTPGETRRLLFVLLGVAASVLLIACVNLAALMLARGVARQRELAVRSALGAGRARLLRQLLLEGLLLALAGGGAGLLVVFWSRRILTNLLTAGLGTMPFGTQPLTVDVDARLAAWTVGLSAVAALACSLLPALRLTRLDATHLKHQAAGTAAPRLTLGRSLIALQIAVSLPLVAGAVLLLRTVSNLGQVELGFEPRGLAFFKLDAAASGAPQDRHAAIYREVLERLRAVPGVDSVSLIENAFLSDITSNAQVTVGGEQRPLYMNAVGPGFLETMGMHLLAGRAVGLQDGPGAPLAGTLNQTAARMLFGAESPIGRTVALGRRTVEVVGVVNDSRYDRQRADVRPILFDSALQRAGFGGHHVVLRTSLPPSSLEAAIRRAVAEVHRDLPVPAIRTQVAQMHDTIARERVLTLLLTIFGGFALLVAGIGLHGLTAYAVSRRRSEIGVRVALGAMPSQVLWLVLRHVLVLALGGLLVGVPLAAALTPLVGSLLYGVAPGDPAVLATAAIVMLTVAVAACLQPARRAARIDPLTALRTE